MSYVANLKQLHIILLEIESSSDNDEVKRRLFNMFGTFEVFQDSNDCINAITNLPAEKTNVFLILVGNQVEFLAELIWQLEQIRFIYLFDQKKEQPCSSNSKNIRFTANHWRDLFISLTRDIELIQDTLPPITVFMYNSNIHERSLRDLCSDHQSATFVWFQLLVDVIRELPQSSHDKEEMIEFCRTYFHNNAIEQGKVEQFLFKSDIKFGFPDLACLSSTFIGNP